jgi:hypothetical protein
MLERTLQGERSCTYKSLSFVVIDTAIVRCVASSLSPVPTVLHCMALHKTSRGTAESATSVTGMLLATGYAQVSLPLCCSCLLVLPSSHDNNQQTVMNLL